MVRWTGPASTTNICARRPSDEAGPLSERRDEPLRRDIGLIGSAFLAFNGLVGAGIFALPGTLHDRFGAFAPWLFPLFGLLALAIAIPFARVAAQYSVSGGPVVYAARFGRVAAFQAGWIFYVARVAALAANLNVLVAYLGRFWPALSEGLGRASVILGVAGAIGAINVIGVRRAIRWLDLLTLAKALPLVLLALYGLIRIFPPELPGAVPPVGELEAAALLVLYAFVGFENGVVPAGETADPRRTIPRALIGTVIATALLYFVIQLAYSGTMAMGAGGDAPLFAFGRALAGEAGALLLAFAAIASVLGNVSGGITGTARTTYAMGRDGLLPAWFGHVDPRYATPARSILVMVALIAVLALSGSFVWLATASVLARMFVYAISIATLPRLAPSRLNWLLSVVAIAICIWVAAQSGWAPWRVLLVLAAIGTALFTATSFAQRRAR